MNHNYLKHFSIFLLLSFTIVSQGCVSSSKNNPQEQGIHEQQIFAIKNVDIIPMTLANEVIKYATVVIDDKKIISINASIPENAKIIDGSGKWLIPGLIDMHVHGLADINFGEPFPTSGPTVSFNTQDVMTPYVANGVTTIFELSARVDHFGQRNEIKRGNVIGPRMAFAALINGGDDSGRVANTPSEGRQTVRLAKAEGYEFIKVYSNLNIETFKAIVDEANKQGLKVVGHIPNSFQGRTKDAFIPHFGMVAHGEEYAKQTEDYNEKDALYFAQLAKENETWLMPTLTTMVRIESQVRSLDGIRNLESLKYVHPLLQSKWLTSNNYNSNTSPERIAYINKLVDFNTLLVKTFKKAGVPIVAGTDAGTSGVVWGFSLHDEIELLVKAGLTQEEALVSATRLPATWLGIEDKTGTIEVGKYADLILLGSNPLTDISNTRDIDGVFVDGQWLDKTEIDTMLSELAKRNDASKEKFNWKKRREY